MKADVVSRVEQLDQRAAGHIVQLRLFALTAGQQQQEQREQMEQQPAKQPAEQTQPLHVSGSALRTGIHPQLHRLRHRPISFSTSVRDQSSPDKSQNTEINVSL